MIWQRIRRLVGVLACLVGHAVGAQPSELSISYQCGPTSLTLWALDPAGWHPADRAGVPVQRRDQVCWVRLGQAPEAGKSTDTAKATETAWLAFGDLHIQRVDIELFDRQAQSLGQASRLGLLDHAWITGRQAVFMLREPVLWPLYARLHPAAGSLEIPALDRHVRINQLDPSHLEPVDTRADLQNMGAVAFLVTTALLALFFLFALRDADYGIYALYATAQAMTHLAKSGLGFVWPSLSFFWLNAGLLQFLVSGLSAWLYLRFGRFRLHSPRMARAAIVICWAFWALIPLQGLAPRWVDTLVYILLPLHFVVGLSGNWNGWRAGERASGLLLIGMSPIALYWLAFLVFAVVLHRPVPVDLAIDSNFDLLRTLVLPAVFCLGLADRTLRALRESSRLLMHDSLTGWLNREGLRGQGQQWVDTGASPQVVVVNIERFHAINEVLGADLGDQLLCEAARRLASAVEPFGLFQLARMHADQFALVLRSEVEPTRLEQALQRVFVDAAEVRGQSVDLSVVAGLAQHTAGQSMVELIRDAEVALETARALRKPWLCYQRSMRINRMADLGLLSQLKQAVAQSELRMYLQPKVRLSDGALSGAEALVRWQHPERGLVPPSEFVPFAEKTGRIAELTHWMLAEAMRFTVLRRQAGQALKISVNLSTHDISDRQFPAWLLRLAGQHGAEPADICLEITEGAAMHDAEAALEVMHELRSAGFSLSIDDFGTGYSSLAYLQKMPVSELKVDRAFVREVHRSSDAQSLLESIIAMGHRLGLVVVAEGAETAEEWMMLRILQCDQAQGWYAARPLPADQFEAWVARHIPFAANQVSSR